jgi:glutathione synthase/RimK-type ligase-like ATP-grasp enzyme
MNILLVRSKLGLPYATHIQDYIRSRDVKCEIADIESLDDVIGKNGFTPDNTLIHARAAGPNVNKKYVSLEKDGFTIVNSATALFLTSNKYKAQVHAGENKIPVAKTYKVKKTDVKKVLELLTKHGRLILKPIYSQGQGIYCKKVTDGIGDGELAAILESIPGDEIQAQEFIDFEKLIRVIVIGFKAIKDATIYDNPDKDGKCSVCVNPVIKKYRGGDDDLFELAERTAKAFNARVNFIDFFQTGKGDFILNEINTACNLLFHEQVSGVKINEVIGNFLIEESERISVR